jgi:hypothetical protein
MAFREAGSTLPERTPLRLDVALLDGIPNPADTGRVHFNQIKVGLAGHDGCSLGYFLITETGCAYRKDATSTIITYKTIKEMIADCVVVFLIQEGRVQEHMVTLIVHMLVLGFYADFQRGHVLWGELLHGQEKTFTTAAKYDLDVRSVMRPRRSDTPFDLIEMTPQPAIDYYRHKVMKRVVRYRITSGEEEPAKIQRIAEPSEIEACL